MSYSCSAGEQVQTAEARGQTDACHGTTATPDIAGDVAIGVPIGAAFPQALGPGVNSFGRLAAPNCSTVAPSTGMPMLPNTLPPASCMPVLSDTLPTWRRPVSLEERIREKYQGM